MKCYECNNEFTAEDKATVNFVSVMGTYSHKMCPGTTCYICKEEIKSFSDGKRDALMRWQHKDCEPVAVNVSEDEPGYDASTWVVKGKK